MTQPASNPRDGLIRCLRVCTRRAHLIVTYRDGSETALCVDHYLALLRYEECAVRTVRGTVPPAPPL